MPYHFEFDRKNRILLVVVTGIYDDELQLGINARIRTWATELKVAAGIGDLSAVTSCTVSSAAVQLAAKESPPYDAQTPRFLVAPGDHVYGLSRMYQIVGDDSRAALEVVRSRREALEALGAPDAVFERLDEAAISDR
jgi:hypothetical protein